MRTLALIFAVLHRLQALAQDLEVICNVNLREEPSFSLPVDLQATSNVTSADMSAAGSGRFELALAVQTQDARTTKEGEL